MRRSSLAATTASVLLALLAAGCAAPLEPESRRQRETPSPGTSASPPAARSSSAAPTGPTTGSPTAPAIPDITVPEALTSPGRQLPDLPVLGADASWPQCPVGMGIPQKRSKGAPMPLPEARFVVLGLTNGPGFTPNPCLADQLSFVRERHLLGAAYSVISWPDPRTLAGAGKQGPYDASTRAGALSNVGYQQARFNVATMERVGLRTPVVWLDVEPVPDFEWSSDTAANAAVVVGAARGYTDAGYRIGVYSTQSLWEVVVGDLRLGLPEWRAAGQTSRAEALRRCGPARRFQGGRAVMSQWVEAGRDQNLTCPGTSREMERWFHRY